MNRQRDGGAQAGEQAGARHDLMAEQLGGLQTLRPIFGNARECRLQGLDAGGGQLGVPTIGGAGRRVI